MLLWSTFPLDGSTNTVLHIPAIAHEAEVKLPLEIFDILSRKTPHIANMIPGGAHYMEDLDNAGGIPAVLNRLQGMINPSLTVSGVNITEIARNAVVMDEEVIRSLDRA